MSFIRSIEQEVLTFWMSNGFDINQASRRMMHARPAKVSETDLVWVTQIIIIINSKFEILVCLFKRQKK